MVGYFRIRAVAAGLVAGVVALVHTLDQEGLLPEEGVEENPEQATGVTQA